MEFKADEVDMDAKKTMVNRSGLAASGENVHVGRLFVMRERSTERKKLTALQDVAVPVGTALPPEDNDDVRPAVSTSLKPGAMGAGDRGRAIKACAKASGGGQVPLTYAMRGNKAEP